MNRLIEHSSAKDKLFTARLFPRFEGDFDAVIGGGEFIVVFTKLAKRLSSRSFVVKLSPSESTRRTVQFWVPGMRKLRPDVDLEQMPMWIVTTSTINFG